MRIPLFLAVAQWALLLALGLLVIVMYRQLGRVLGQTKAAEGLGPAVGAKAVGFEYARATDNTRHEVTPGTGQPLLIAFADPTCPACEQLVGNLDVALEAGDLAGLRPLLLISDPPSYLEISAAFRVTRLETGQVTSHGVREAYNAVATPLLVAIDRTGVVRAAGSVRQLTEVRAFARACRADGPAAALPVLPGDGQSSAQHPAHPPVPAPASGPAPGNE